QQLSRSYIGYSRASIVPGSGARHFFRRCLSFPQSFGGGGFLCGPTPLLEDFFLFLFRSGSPCLGLGRTGVVVEPEGLNTGLGRGPLNPEMSKPVGSVKSTGSSST